MRRGSLSLLSFAMRKFLLLSYFVLAVFTGFAKDFVYEGLNYNVLDEEAHTCQTAFGVGGRPGNSVSGDLVIPATVFDGDVEYKVVGIGIRGFMGNVDLKTVSFPETLVSIGSLAFNQCFNLNGIIIPPSVTTVSEDSFQGCNNPGGIGMDGWVSQIKGAYPDLLDINPFGEGGRYSVAYPVEDSIIKEGWIYNKEGNAIYYAPKSVEGDIIIPENIEWVGRNSFFDCRINSLIILPTLKTIEPNAFSSYIDKYAYPNTFTISEDISGEGLEYPANDYCIENGRIYNKNKTELYFVPVGVEGIVTIPVGVVKIMGKAFSKCDKMTSVEMPESLQSIGEEAFSQCKALGKVNIPDGVTTIGSGAFRQCRALEMVSIPTSLDKISQSLFDNCESLKSVDIPESVKTIGDYAFYYCKSLSSIMIPDKVVSIGNNAFSDCSSLSSIQFPDGVALGSYAFSNCTSLISVRLPDNLTVINNGLFRGCTLLTSIQIPDGVASIGDEAFSYCSSITTFRIPDGVSVISDGLFRGCTSLSSVLIPDGISRIGSSSFYDCISLKSINIPEGVTTISGYAFYNSGLESINIPNSVKWIEYDAFKQCKDLKEVWIPESIEDFGSEVWSECNSIKDVYYAASHPIEGQADLFPESVYSNATLHLRESAIPEAEGIDPWRLFLNKNAYDFSAGIDGIVFDSILDIEPEIFGLDGKYIGKEVTNLDKGIYIVKQGRVTRKIFIK